MGVLADKEYEEVVRQTVSLAAEVITVMTPDNPRALPAEELANTVKKYNSHVRQLWIWHMRKQKKRMPLWHSVRYPIWAR